MKKKKIYIGILIIGIFISIFMIYWFQNPFVDEYTIEAGNSIKIEDLIEDPKVKDPQFVTKIDKSIINKVGQHKITVKANDRTFNININVVDTIPPRVTTCTYNYFIGDQFDAYKFIKKLEDQTDVKIKMNDKVDLNKEGKYNVTISCSDEGNNQITKKVKLNIQKDTEAPIIEAPNSIFVVKGESVIYKKYVKVKDNRDGIIKQISVDSSQVNLNKTGSYYVVFKAQDSTGNKSTKKVLVVVTTQQASQAKKEAKKYANIILKKIIDDSMTDDQKLKAIYNYVRENYRYTSQHEGTIDDYYVDALNGFKTRKGDCYVVNAMARFLLDEVGIESIGLVLHGSDMNHISFMVNLGDGWYHYCAFKKLSGVRIYKWTDQQMIDYYSFCGIRKIPSTVPKTPQK